MSFSKLAPDEIWKHIFSFVEENYNSRINCLSVCHSWSRFFHQKHMVLLNKLSQTFYNTIFEDNGLAKLKSLIDDAYSQATQQQAKKQLFLIVKSFEAKVMNIDANPRFYGVDAPQVTAQELTKYTMEKFGIVSLINAYTFERSTKTEDCTDEEDSSRAFSHFFVLQTVLRTHPQETSWILDWINTFLSQLAKGHRGLFYQMSRLSNLPQLVFKENSLCFYNKGSRGDSIVTIDSRLASLQSSKDSDNMFIQSSFEEEYQKKLALFGDYDLTVPEVKEDSVCTIC